LTVLSDEERVTVGLYTNKSRLRARSRRCTDVKNIAHHIANPLSRAPQVMAPLVYCCAADNQRRDEHRLRPGGLGATN